jgi:hypothetical protein
MNILIAWVLVTWIPASSATLQYSPPVATKASCEALMAAVNELPRTIPLRHKCVQVEVLK